MTRVVAYNEELAGRIRATLADRTEVAERKMFGGLSFMVAGQMCCGVLQNDLVVRIEPADFDQLVARPHVRSFDFTGRPMQGMVYVESSGVTDPAVLREWVHRGTDYVAAQAHLSSPSVPVRTGLAPSGHHRQALDIVPPANGVLFARHLGW